jgi:hypothetical protein
LLKRFFQIYKRGATLVVGHDDKLLKSAVYTLMTAIRSAFLRSGSSVRRAMSLNAQLAWIECVDCAIGMLRSGLRCPLISRFGRPDKFCYARKNVFPIMSQLDAE